MDLKEELKKRFFSELNEIVLARPVLTMDYSGFGESKSYTIENEFFECYRYVNRVDSLSFGNTWKSIDFWIIDEKVVDFTEALNNILPLDRRIQKLNDCIVLFNEGKETWNIVKVDNRFILQLNLFK